MASGVLDSIAHSLAESPWGGIIADDLKRKQEQKDTQKDTQIKKLATEQVDATSDLLNKTGMSTASAAGAKEAKEAKESKRDEPADLYVYVWTGHGSFEGYRHETEYHKILMGEKDAIMTKYPFARPYVPIQVMGNTKVEDVAIQLKQVNIRLKEVLKLKEKLEAEAKSLAESPPKPQRFFFTDSEYGIGKRQHVIVSDDAKLAEQTFRDIEKLKEYRRIGVFTPETITAKSLEAERQKELDDERKEKEAKRKKLLDDKARIEAELEQQM